MLDFILKCPNCGAIIISESLTHCTACGDELAYFINQGYECVGCGDDVEEDWAYCGHCGIYLDWSDKDYVKSEES
jgi:rRNA maturation endonuclease Nob1